MNHRKNSKWWPFFDDVIKDFEIFDFLKKYRQLLKCNHKRMTKDFSILFAFRKSKDLRPQQGQRFLRRYKHLAHTFAPKLTKNTKKSKN